jgi:high-affinity iron transporter
VPDTVAAYFFYSFGIIFREGLEATLVVVALAAGAREIGRARSERDVYRGALIAVALSIALAWVVNYLISDQTTHTFEGAFQLLAAATLFYVSSWLTARSQADRWREFINARVQKAKQAAIPALALGGAAFLAVFREGAESVVFIQSLVMGATAPGETRAVLAGIAVGAAALATAFVVLRRAAFRLPIHAFFSITSVILYGLAVVFVGEGIAAWQEAEIIRTTFIDHVPEIAVLGIYPTLEGVTAQAALLVVALAAILAPRERARRERLGRQAAGQAGSRAA